MSRKWTLQSGKLSTVNLMFLSEEFIRSCLNLRCFFSLKVRCHQHNSCILLLKELSTKSLTKIFPNSVMIVFARTELKGDPIDTPSICL